MYPFFSFLLGLSLDLPSHMRNEKWAFLIIKRRFLAGVIASYLGFRDFPKYRELLMAGGHVTPQFRAKYQKYLNWENIQKYTSTSGYTPPTYPKTTGEHLRLLWRLGYHNNTEINQIIAHFESGLSDPYNFPLMTDDLRRLPPSYVQASEYDTLRDDALIFARRLQQSGTRVTLDYQQHGWYGNIQFSQTLIKTTSPVNVFHNVTKFIRNVMRENNEL